MADGISVTLVGHRKLARLLKRIPAKDAKKAIRKGSRAGVKIITNKVKQNAPVESGNVRRAVKTRATKRSRRYIGTKTTIGEGFFKGDTFYAAFVELGHYAGKRRGGKKSRGAHGRKFVKGTHFMERAVKSVQARAGRKAVVIIRREIEAAARMG